MSRTAQKARLDAYALRELRETAWQQNSARLDEALANYQRIEAEIAATHRSFIADMQGHIERIEKEIGL